MQNYQEGICPICGAELQYEGSYEQVDDGALLDWVCPKCKARGKSGYDLVFDRYYQVFDADGNAVSLEDEPERGRANPTVSMEKIKGMDSHWQEVMNMAKQYGFIIQSYGGSAVLLTHKNQLEARGAEQYLFTQKQMFGNDMEQ